MVRRPRWPLACLRLRRRRRKVCGWTIRPTTFSDISGCGWRRRPLSVAIVGVETVLRSRRVHSGLADEMVQSAVEQLLPAGVAGVLLTVVLFHSAPESLWLLPGLWQIIFSLGIFSSCHFLPRAMYAVGAWYLGSGLVCIALANGQHAFSPWRWARPLALDSCWSRPCSRRQTEKTMVSPRKTTEANTPRKTASRTPDASPMRASTASSTSGRA